ncbi:MAG: hypothetical protein M3122_06355 [Actinomycetota bacterium]|nr:hypothetical protein [Actinomycetota bacterium]
MLGRMHPHERTTTGPIRETNLELRANHTLHEYLSAHAANLERALRLGEKAERLEEAGTPSESVRNRAERARGEVVAGLATLRASFIKAPSEREGAYAAFDRALGTQCPAFAPQRCSNPRPRQLL